MTPEDLRRLLRRHAMECDRIHAKWRGGDYAYPPPPSLPFPDELRGLACGAKTRAGTPEGKAKAALNRWRPKKKRSS